MSSASDPSDGRLTPIVSRDVKKLMAEAIERCGVPETMTFMVSSPAGHSSPAIVVRGRRIDGRLSRRSTRSASTILGGVPASNGLGHKDQDERADGHDGQQPGQGAKAGTGFGRADDPPEPGSEGERDGNARAADDRRIDEPPPDTHRRRGATDQPEIRARAHEESEHARCADDEEQAEHRRDALLERH